MFIPQEITDGIISSLTIIDAGSLLRAITNTNDQLRPASPCFFSSTMLLRAINRRLDQKVFLGRALYNTRQLVQCMSRTGAAIIGPRAFSYFTAGEVVGNAWDFLTQWSPIEIIEILIALEKSGVVWETPMERADRIYRSCSGCRERLAAEERVDGSHRADDGFNPGNYVRNLLRIFSTCRRDLSPGTNALILGKTRNGKARIRLHIQSLPERHASAITAPFMFICGGNMSHLQCLVSGFAAVHMYSSSITSDTTYLWDSSQELAKRAYSDILSEERSLSHPIRSHHTIRSLRDDESLVINLARFSEIDTEVANVACNTLKESVWYEYCNATAYIDNIIDYASARRVLPFIQYMYGEHSSRSHESIVGPRNHGFDTSSAQLVLEDKYGIFLSS